MKGIAHFAMGVAVATFFPEIVQAAAQGLAFGPLLGGLAGLLPDTLDFKLLRYLDQPDVEIDPARLVTAGGDPDPQAMAEALAAAVDRAYEGGRRVIVQLHTQRLAGDLWRRWRLAIDPERGGLSVHLGPAVTTAQAVVPGRECPGPAGGTARTCCPLRYGYDAEIEIDIFQGPSLALVRAGEGVAVTFLPWHRAWSHSLLAAALVGAAGALIAPAYGLAMAAALLAHVAMDQLGHLGSNLFFPLGRQRTPGLGLIRSGDGLPNLAAVWLSGALILFNLDRFSTAAVLPPVPYLVWAVAVPGLLLLAAGLWRARPREARLAAASALEEMGEVDI
ncbi:MAG: metal-dependent hydrolase [Anaerolineae bacterium]|jgi:hypothetical protein